MNNTFVLITAIVSNAICLHLPEVFKLLSVHNVEDKEENGMKYF